MRERGDRSSLIQRLGKGIREVGSEAEEIALMPVTYAKALRERKVRADGINLDNHYRWGNWISITSKLNSYWSYYSKYRYR